MTVRVVQWATGPVGRHAAAAVVDHPDLELVGCFAYDPAKDGVDVGTICGFGPTGVLATTDVDGILALDADCVLYMAQGDADPAGALDAICRLLERGLDVVSTAVTPLIYPRAMGDDVVTRLEAACARGGSTFHATGIEPGWAAEVLPLVVSGVVRSVERITVREIIDYATYDNAFMLCDVMGFGHRPDSTGYLAADPALLGSVFRSSILMVADALEATVDSWQFHRDTWLAPESFRIPAGPIEAGTIAALRFGATAVIDGRPAITVEHVTRLREGDAPDWPADRGWHVSVEGLPSLELSARVAAHGEDETDQGCLATAMHAVHAVVPVHQAEPGIATLRDLPTVVGRHVFRRPVTRVGR